MTNERLPIPAENAMAAFPPVRRVGKVALRPVAIGDVVALARYGVDVCSMSMGDTLVAAYVLAQPDASQPPAADLAEYKRFARGMKRSEKGVSDAVRRQAADALSTYVPGRHKKRMGGCGWPLEIAEFLCAEYGWTWRDALRTPLATAFALLAVSRERYGGENAGPDYIERQKAKSLMEESRSRK